MKKHTHLVVEVENEHIKEAEFVGSAQDDLKEFPREVMRVMGYTIDRAQRGEMHPDAKPLRGFGGASVIEMVDTDPSGTYRAVYTVKFRDVVYVLHAFQKKSKSGIATPQAE